MKTLATLFAAALFSFSAAPIARAQITHDSISTGPGNQQQVFYSMENGVVHTAPLSSWDIGFEVTGFTSSIITNGGTGIILYAIPGKTVEDWTTVIDTVGLHTWVPLNNSLATWTSGAFNMGSDPNSGNFGWGEYNMITHVVTGTTLYMIKTPTGPFRKIAIERLANRTYTFRFANLDGSDETTAAISKEDHPGRQFAYYSLTDKRTVEVAPSSGTWDLVFGKYTAILSGGVPYGVTGVLAHEGVQLAQVHTTDAETAPLPSSEQFTDSIGLIGYDWKSFNGTGYSIDTNTAYFVHSVDGNFYRVRFTGFGGGSTGKIYFDKTLMAASHVGSEAREMASFAIYPSVLEQSQPLTIVHASNVNMNSALVEIHDIRGVRHYSQSFALQGMAATNIHPELNSGTYFVTMTIDGNSATQRLIVQ